MFGHRLPLRPRRFPQQEVDDRLPQTVLTVEDPSHHRQNELKDAIVDFCLTPERGHGEWFDTLMVSAMDGLAAGTDLETITRRTADAHERAIAADRGFLSQMALWSLSSSDPAVAERLSRLYAWYADGGIDFVGAVFGGLAGVGHSLTAGRTAHDFLVTFTAMTEGLCVRRTFDADSVPAGITSSATVAIVEAFVGRPAIGSMLGWVGGPLALGELGRHEMSALRRPGRHVSTAADVPVANVEVSADDLRTRIIQWCATRLQSANLDWLDAVTAADLGRDAGLSPQRGR